MASKQPKNRNMLSGQWHHFSITDMDTVNYFCQTVTLPAVSLPQTTTPTPNVELNHAGDHLDYETLTIQFKVDEDMANYLELFDWMKGLGFDESTDQYEKLRQMRTNLRPQGGVSSEGRLLILNSNYNPKLEVSFVYLQPLSISSLDFDTRTTDVEYLTCTATFSYDYFKIRRL